MAGRLGKQVTVLDKYQRLEAEAVWRRDRDEQRRDVIVSIGEATLTITDLNDAVLAHWSLPAIERKNPGTRPAIYSPGTDAPETLEISDKVMIDALNKVLKAIRRQGRHPGRLRALIFGGSSLVLLMLGVFWLPGALASYASAIIPNSARSDIGRELMGHVKRVTGEPCSSAAADTALATLSASLFPGQMSQIFILPSALATTEHLPGGTLLASHKLVEDHETPNVLIGYLLAENQRREDSDPFRRLMKDAGLGAALKLLTTGEMNDEALKSHAERLIASKTLPIDAQVVAGQMSSFGFEPQPYLDDANAEIVTKLPLADTAVDISDSDWISLQQICEN